MKKDFDKWNKEKLEALLELSNNHRSFTSGSVGNPKSNLSVNETESKVKKIESPLAGTFSEAEATNINNINKSK